TIHSIFRYTLPPPPRPTLFPYTTLFRSQSTLRIHQGACRPQRCLRPPGAADSRPPWGRGIADYGNERQGPGSRCARPFRSDARTRDAVLSHAIGERARLQAQELHRAVRPGDPPSALLERAEHVASLELADLRLGQ